MTPEGAVEVVTRLYAAAHWVPGESDYLTYHEALGDVTDHEASRATREIVAHVNPSEVRYSPALLRDTVLAVRLRDKAKQRALPEDTSPAADPQVAAQGLAEVRRALAKARGPLAADLRRAAPKGTPNDG